MHIKKINNQIVKPMRFTDDDDEDTRPVKGSAIFPTLNANIFLIAKKHSGKTVTVGKIIKECASSSTTVICICSTIYKDIAHKKIKKYCKLHNIPYIGFTSMIYDGVNVLDTLMDFLEDRAEMELEEEYNPKEKTSPCLFNDSDEEVEKKRKSKYQVPEYIIYLDDLSNELKNPSLLKLFCEQRHSKMKVIVSTQYLTHIHPSSHCQCDYSLIFGGMPDEKLEKLHDNLDLAIPFDKFYTLYKNATEKKYSFFYIDIRDETFRRNFNHQYILD